MNDKNVFIKTDDDTPTERFSWPESFVIVGIAWAIAYTIVGILRG